MFITKLTAALRFVVWLVTVMVTMPAIAAPVLVSPNVDEIRLGQHSYYLEDPENRLDIGDTHRLAKNHWQPSPSDIPNFGYTDSTYWFRLQFNYSGTEPDRRLLAIDYALLDQVSIYVFKHKILSREYHTGDTLPFDTRPLTHRDFLFPIAFQPGEETTVFIRVKTQGSTQVPMSLWKEQAYLLSDQTRLISQSIYYGMMIVMVLYNFFLFLSLRERAYLYYVGFVFSFLCMQASMHGVLFQYVFPDLPSLQELFVLFFVPSTMLFSCLFTESLLRLKSYAPRLSQSLRFIIVLSLGCIAGAFVLPYATSTQVSVFLVIPASILIFVSGPIAWYRGHKVARFFTIAWFSLLMGTTAAAMNKYGIIPRNGITEYGLQWGSALEAILLSFALADMLNREREARFKAQHAKLEEARRREIAEQKLIYQATHNATNGFPNVTVFRNRLLDILQSPQPQVRRYIIVMIHLNRFHEINKTLGHLNAEVILQRFSNQLTANLDLLETTVVMETTASGDHCIAHLEGALFASLHWLNDGLDEFVVDIRQFLSKISEPVKYQDMNIDLGLSLSITPNNDESLETWMRNAQIAVELAEAQNDQICVYSPDINPYNERRLRLMGELKTALDSDSLELHYQPQWCYQKQCVTGFEALIRWPHPTLGMVSPDEFIPLAEKTGLIRYVTTWVIDRALKDRKTLLSHRDFKDDESPLHKDIAISVNISAMNLRENDFVQMIQKQIQKYDIDPQHLILEITETSVMQEPEQALSRLKQLSALGVRLSIDDFGIGHSSLSYIKKLPVQEIKIDRSFVMEMDKSRDDAVIVETTLRMCHNLGYKVVAEGIENLQIFKSLEQMTCDYAQGYYLSKPMPLNQVTKWLKSHQVITPQSPQIASQS